MRNIKKYKDIFDMFCFHILRNLSRSVIVVCTVSKSVLFLCYFYCATMTVSKLFTRALKCTHVVECTQNRVLVNSHRSPTACLSIAAREKNKISHVYFKSNANSKLGSYSQLSYIGQDVRKIPPVLSKLYGDKTQSLDLSYNCLTSIQELSNFPHLSELVLDNNQLTDTIVLPKNLKLHTLSLNKNNITNLDLLIKQIEQNLPNLRYLSLLGNEACPNELSHPDKDDEDYQRYRYYVLYCLPNLQFLDSRIVTEDERMEARNKGKFMKVVRPSFDNSELNESEELEEEKKRRYTPLSPQSRHPNDHKGMIGRCKFRYAGKHSEGNRFILNEDL